MICILFHVKITLSESEAKHKTDDTVKYTSLNFDNSIAAADQYETLTPDSIAKKDTKTTMLPSKMGESSLTETIKAPSATSMVEGSSIRSRQDVKDVKRSFSDNDRGLATENQDANKSKHSRIQEHDHSYELEEKDRREPILEDKNSNDHQFLSFEEWKVKKQKYQKDTQNYKSEKIGKGEASSAKEGTPRTPGTPENNDTIGFDNEDQGEQYKDRFNYASTECAATVVKTNLQSKGASAILVENKDSYMLNQCSLQQKFVIIELCQDILVDTLIVGNFEFFSSTFRHIRVSVSDRYPVDSPSRWQVLGVFEAANVRDIQSFSIENPLIWARYLKIEVLSHYGDEYYCPISLVRVHGKTMMEEYKISKEEDEKEKVPLSNDAPNSTEESNNNISEADDFGKGECYIPFPPIDLAYFLEHQNASDDYCDANSLPSISEPSDQNAKGIQESIYKNIMKRLSLLEKNTTMSLMYVQEISKELANAFQTWEKNSYLKSEASKNSLNESFQYQFEKLKEELEERKVYNFNSDIGKFVFIVYRDIITSRITKILGGLAFCFICLTMF